MSPHFKPETSALVLIDHQVGTMQLIKNIPSDVPLRNAVALAKAAKSFGMPILMTTSQEDHVQGPTADALQRVAPEAYAVRIKRTGVVNAWDDPAFRDAVLGLGRRQLVMAAVRHLPRVSRHQRGRGGLRGAGGAGRQRVSL